MLMSTECKFKSTMSLGRKMKTNIILTHNYVVHLRKRTMEEILGIKVTRLLV